MGSPRSKLKKLRKYDFTGKERKRKRNERYLIMSFKSTMKNNPNAGDKQ